ncbi:hypothetical protein BMF35_b0178 [Aurantiacibacter gangjinensis]|nr:hypothetical protein BMF35_b0178 [Aurantiacibacter gangjinensis]
MLGTLGMDGRWMRGNRWAAASDGMAATVPTTAIGSAAIMVR